MKYLFTTLFVLVLFAAASAQSKVTKEPSLPLPTAQSSTSIPTLENGNGDAIALAETEFDFGKIPQGKPVTHEFVFTNTGSAPLALENVQASCGCTTPEWSKEAVAPGASSKITVGYNAAADGLFSKSITLTYNGNKSREILIKGEVWKTPETSAPDNSALNTLKNQ